MHSLFTNKSLSIAARICWNTQVNNLWEERSKNEIIFQSKDFRDTQNVHTIASQSFASHYTHARTRTRTHPITSARAGLHILLSPVGSMIMLKRCWLCAWHSWCREKAALRAWRMRGGAEWVSGWGGGWMKRVCVRVWGGDSVFAPLTPPSKGARWWARGWVVECKSGPEQGVLASVLAKIGLSPSPSADTSCR